MAAEKKTAPVTVCIGDMKIVNPDLPTSHARPPFRSKADNFNREMCKEEIEKLWGPILLYGQTLESLDSVEKVLSPWFEDIKDGQLIYNEQSDSSVYKVKNKHNGNDKIIKVYQTSDRNGKEHSHHICRTINTYNLMIHTNLLQYGAICKGDNTKAIHIAMEPLQMTLEQYVKQNYGANGKGINELKCKSIIMDILDNLWTLHIAGCIHCDIKPENIMLRDRSWKPEFNGWKLIDFDNRYFLGLNEYEFICAASGSFGWFAPEINPLIKNQIFKGKGNYFSYGYDIWSLGLIILYILFGTQPYDRVGWIMTPRHWYKKELLKGDKYDMDSDKNKGEIWLRNYLMDLYVNDKISQELFDLLHNHMLIFDPRERSNCIAFYSFSVTGATSGFISS